LPETRRSNARARSGGDKHEDPEYKGDEMKRAMTAVVLSGIAVVLSCGTVLAQPTTDLGKSEYYAKCAVCHGLSGKGEGSFGEVLKVNMPDLTLIAKRNGGAFPVDRVKMAIDGRATPRAHGTSEMPIWGTRYSVEAAPKFDDYRYDPEAFVQVRVLALVDYLYRLQAR
jgi:mono/diheme cytochrome c family protein